MKTIIKKIAAQAKLKIESRELTNQVTQIINSFNTLKSVDINNIQPTYSTLGYIENLREDRAESCDIEIKNFAPKAFKKFIII